MKLSDLPSLEREAIDLLLEGEDATMQALRGQLASVVGVERTETGAGVYVIFTLVADVERAPNAMTFHIADVVGVSSTCNDEVEFILFVKEGLIEYLEAYTYSDSYPSYLESKFELTRAAASVGPKKN